MKSLSNILLYVFSALAVISGAYVILSPGAMASENDWNPDKAPVNFIIWVTVIIFVLSVVLFFFYKVVDIIKHPSHTKEFLYVAGAVLISLIIGFIFSSSDEVIYGNGEVYPGGVGSKLIGTGIVSIMVLLFAAVAYMVYDTVKGLLKS
ncbi:hypothetical protein [Ornithobacterium rhinotracheale]|nr:hypothetical protein [Ornithobacterium rhinotracheale]MCK0202417.1 hypothetical protein [Ornithobacterium rhinotracheale]MCK0204915.1 hypothetical protein [Ornithobacterium rhinotracheale]